MTHSVPGILPFFMYDLPVQRKMDLDEMVLTFDPNVNPFQRDISKQRQRCRFKTEDEIEYQTNIRQVVP